MLVACSVDNSELDRDCEVLIPHLLQRIVIIIQFAGVRIPIFQN